jgi:hypothetical protein
MCRRLVTFDCGCRETVVSACVDGRILMQPRTPCAAHAHLDVETFLQRRGRPTGVTWHRCVHTDPPLLPIVRFPLV